MPSIRYFRIPTNLKLPLLLGKALFALSTLQLKCFCAYVCAYAGKRTTIFDSWSPGHCIGNQPLVTPKTCCSHLGSITHEPEIIALPKSRFLGISASQKGILGECMVYAFEQEKGLVILI